MAKYNLNTRLRSAIRQTWLRSPHRYAILKQARMGRGVYECAKCKGEFSMRELQVDHITPIGPIGFVNSKPNWTDFVYSLFFGEMQALCKPCHKIKTKSEK